jgi:hypothetical protein
MYMTKLVEASIGPLFTTPRGVNLKKNSRHMVVIVLCILEGKVETEQVKVHTIYTPCSLEGTLLFFSRHCKRAIHA